MAEFFDQKQLEKN